MTTPEHTTSAQPTCHAQQCPVKVADDEFMCPPHWQMVPAPMRAAIQASYRPNTEPSAEFLAIARGAIDAVAHKEARTPPRKKSATPATTPQKPTVAAPKTSGRRRRKAVQLALFELSESQ